MKINNLRKEELLSLFEMHLTRVDMLPCRQMAFVKLFLSSGEYNALAKMTQLNVATIARRLKKIAGRICSDNFITALTAKNDPADKKTKTLKEYFVNGTTVTAIVKNTGLSRYEVEKIIKSELKK